MFLPAARHLPPDYFSGEQSVVAQPLIFKGAICLSCVRLCAEQFEAAKPLTVHC